MNACQETIFFCTVVRNIILLLNYKPLMSVSRLWTSYQQGIEQSLPLALDCDWRRKYRLYKGQDVSKLQLWGGGVWGFFLFCMFGAFEERGLQFWGILGSGSLFVCLYVLIGWLGFVFSHVIAETYLWKECTFNLTVVLNVFDRMWSLAASCINRPKIIRQQWIIWSSNKIVMHTGIFGN